MFDGMTVRGMVAWQPAAGSSVETFDVRPRIAWLDWRRRRLIWPCRFPFPGMVKDGFDVHRIGNLLGRAADAILPLGLTDTSPPDASQKVP